MRGLQLDVDIHIHTNKTHLESYLRVDVDSGNTLGDSVDYRPEKHPYDAPKGEYETIQAKQRLLDKLVSISYVHVCNFFHGVYHRYKYIGVAKPVDSSGDDRIRQLRERCFGNFNGTCQCYCVCRYVGDNCDTRGKYSEGSKFQENTFYKIFMVCIIVTQMMLAFMATTFGMSLMNRIQSVAGYQQSMSKQFKAMM